MRLNSWQIFTLTIPFIISILLYTFNDTIVQNIHSLSPKYDENDSFINFDKKTGTYLAIGVKSKFYKEMEKKISARQSNAFWISKYILYETAREETSKTSKSAWRLQMVYPKHKIAIINGKIKKLNEMIDGAKIIKIENLSVLLEYNKRQTWVTLFQ